MKKKIVNYTEQEIQGTLEKLLNSPYAALISNVIVKNLQTTPMGLEGLIKAFAGVEMRSNFNVLDEVLVPFVALPEWRYNEKLMKDSKIINKGMVSAVIININLLETLPIAIEYDAYPADKEVTEKCSYSVSEDVLVLKSKDFL